MAYAVKYRFLFDSDAGVEYRIDLMSQNYEGLVIQRPVGSSPVLKRDENAPVYGTSLEINAECQVDGELAELYTTDARQFRTDLYRDNVLIWQGYITPELYSEPDIAPPYDVRIIATDGLGELKMHKFYSNGERTIAAHLQAILAETALDTTIDMVSTLTGGTTPFEGLTVDLGHLDGKTCYDALCEILNVMHAGITRQGNRWLIFRESDLAYYGLSPTVLGSMGASEWWPVGQLTSTIQPAKKYTSVAQKPSKKSNILQDIMSDNWSTPLVDGVLRLNSLDGTHQVVTSASRELALGEALPYSYTVSMGATGQGGSYTQKRRFKFTFKVRGGGTNGRESRTSSATYFILARIKLFSTAVGTACYAIRQNEEGYYIGGSSNDTVKLDISRDTCEGTIDAAWNAGNGMEQAAIHRVEIYLQNPTNSSIWVEDIILTIDDEATGVKRVLDMDNSAREDDTDHELTFPYDIIQPGVSDSQQKYSPAFYGIAKDGQGNTITSWSTSRFSSTYFLSVIAADYGLSVALPRLLKTGNLNVPTTTGAMPFLFKDGPLTFFAKTFEHRLADDEVDVSLISLPAADMVQYEEYVTSYEPGSSSSSSDSSDGGASSAIPYMQGQIAAFNTALESKLDKAFFSRVFAVKDANGNTIEPNTYQQTVDNLQILVGTWTQSYLTALGISSGHIPSGDVTWEDLITRPVGSNIKIDSAYIKLGTGLAVDSNGLIYVTNESGTAISAITLTGDVLSITESNGSVHSVNLGLSSYAPLTSLLSTVTVGSTSYTVVGTNVTLPAYLPLAGGTMANTNRVINLNADLLDGIEASDFARMFTSSTLSANDYSNLPAVYGGKLSGGTNMPYTYRAFLHVGASTSYMQFNGYGNDLAYRASGLSDTPSWRYVAFRDEVNTALAGYLPLTGGTMTGELTISTTGYANQLEVRRNEANYDAVIRFSNATDGVLGHIGIAGSATGSGPVYNAGVGATNHWILHSGNYGSYALPLAGGMMNTGAQITVASCDVPGYTEYSGGIYLRERNYLGSTLSNVMGDAPGISFVWGGSFVNKLWMNMSGDIAWGSYKFWHEGNDGSGSGLDADLLDGCHNGELSALIMKIGTSTVDANVVWEGSDEIRIYKFSGVSGTNFPANYPYGYLHNYGWAGTANGWRSQIYFTVSDYGNKIFTRGYREDTAAWSAWHEVAFLDSNVASATKLATARTIWGQSFDGTANVSGALSGVTTMDFSGQLRHAGHGVLLSETGTNWQSTTIIKTDWDSTLGDYTDIRTAGAGTNTGFIRLTKYGLVGINAASPSYALDVSGDARVSNRLYIGTSGAYIYYDGTGLHINTGLASDSYLTALGVSGGSSAIGDVTWADLVTRPSGSTRKIDSNYLKLGTGLSIDSNGNIVSSGGSSSEFNEPVLFNYSDDMAGDGSNLYINGNSIFGYIGPGALGTEYVWINPNSSSFGLCIGENAGVDGMLNVDGDAYADAFRQNSDERLKKNIRNIELSITDIADAPAVTFDWIDERKGSGEGTIAQHWVELLPNSVKIGKDGYLSMDYASTALVNTIMIAREVVKLRQEVEQLKQGRN